MRSENWRIKHYHAKYHQNAKNRPNYLNFLLMFFIEKHILNIPQYEKFSTKKNLEKYISIQAVFDTFGDGNIVFCLEYLGLVE